MLQFFLASMLRKYASWGASVEPPRVFVRRHWQFWYQHGNSSATLLLLATQNTAPRRGRSSGIGHTLSPVLGVPSARPGLCYGPRYSIQLVTVVNPRGLNVTFAVKRGPSPAK